MKLAEKLLLTTIIKTANTAELTPLSVMPQLLLGFARSKLMAHVEKPFQQTARLAFSDAGLLEPLELLNLSRQMIGDSFSRKDED